MRAGDIGVRSLQDWASGRGGGDGVPHAVRPRAHPRRRRRPPTGSASRPCGSARPLVGRVVPGPTRPGRGDGPGLPRAARARRRVRQERRGHRRARRPRVRLRRGRHGHRGAAARQPPAAAVPAAGRPGRGQPDGLQQRRRRGRRPPAGGTARHEAPRRRWSASTSARPRRSPTRRRVADYEKSTRLLAPYADYLVVNVSSPNTPGLRDLQAVERLRPLLTAVRRQADAVTSDAPAAAREDRPRPVRRGRARRRRPGRWSSAWTASSPPTPRSAARVSRRARSRSRRPVRAGSPGRRSGRGRSRCCGCCAAGSART